MAIASAVQAIIPVFSGAIHDEQSQLVDARELHSFLEVKMRFNDWISRRINDYEFIESEDFVLITQNRVTKGRGGDRRSKAYHITLDMAKELSMVERNEKGRQARRYFIECEKRLRKIAPSEAETIQAKTIGTDGFHVLSDLIAKKTKVLPSGIQRQAKHRMWSMLHTRFNVPRTELIAANDMDSACNFVAAYSLEGEYIPASRNDDHVTINLPKAPHDRFDNLPAARLIGMDIEYCSKLAEMLDALLAAKRNDQYVRVMDVSAAMVEVDALRHLLEKACNTLESVSRQAGYALNFTHRLM